MSLASALRRRRTVLGVLAALLITTACVGRPKETSGEFPSFLPSGNGVSAVPTNVGGNSDTSGIGAGLLQSPGTAPSATPTPGK